MTRLDNQHVRQVARSQQQVFIQVVGDHQHGVQPHALQFLRQQLGLGRIDRQSLR